jgi:uncharacterized membrane protein
LIHCWAWKFNFPTLVESWLWRGAAISSVIVPLSVLVADLLLRGAGFFIFVLLSQWDFSRIKKFLQRWDKLKAWIQIPGLVIYLLARLAIIGVALSCLRSAPRGMYWGTWTNFLPTIR